MKLRVKDLICPPIYAQPGGEDLSCVPQSDCLFWDESLRATLCRLLNRLQPERSSAVTVLLGEARSGKTHLLRLLRALLRDPAGPLRRKLLPSSSEPEISSRLWLTVDLTDSQATEPDIWLKRQVIEAASAQGVILPEAESADLLQLWRSLPHHVSVVITIDDFETVLKSQTEAAARLYALITELASFGSQSPAVLLAMRLEELETISGDEARSRLQRLMKMAEIVQVDCASLLNAALGSLASKTLHQQREVAWIFHHLKQRLPHLSCEEHEFINCYPLHPSVLRLTQQLWRYLPQFKLTQFVLDCLCQVYQRPAVSLFTLDDLFVLLEHQLRQVTQLQDLFAAYDQVMSQAVERLHQEWRLWGRLLAQALLLHTAINAPATSQELADDCLLYSLDGLSASYQVIAELLDQMHRLAPDCIRHDGAAEPRYELSRPAELSIEERLLTESDAISDAAPALFDLLLACGGGYFQDWPQQFSDEAKLGSQPDDGSLWRVEREPEGILLMSASASLSLLIRHWAAADKTVRGEAADFEWIPARPTPDELRMLKSYAVLRKWQQSGALQTRSPQFAHLLADYRQQAGRLFVRLFILEGRLNQNAPPIKPILIDQEPPFSLSALLRADKQERSSPSLPVSTLPAANNEAVDELLWRYALSRALTDGTTTAPERESFTALLQRWQVEWVSLDLTPAISLLEKASAESRVAGEWLQIKEQLDELAAILREKGSHSEDDHRHGLDRVKQLFDHSPLRFRTFLLQGMRLRAFNDWLPQWEAECRYLQEARVAEGDQLYPFWQGLSTRSKRLLDFLQAKKRAEWMDGVEAYRRLYTHRYLALHRQLSSEQIELCLAQVRSSPQWLNLEHLSQLPLIESRYWDSAKRLVDEIERRRCDLDPQRALLYQARCNCGFAADEAPHSLRGRVMELLRQGLNHCSQVLGPIALDLLEQSVPELADETIASELAQLGQGSFSGPISASTIDLLKRAIAGAAALSAN
jgi:hypothetical protein